MTDLATTTHASPVPFKMAHFVLRCTRYREVVDWHLKVFNAHVVHENDFLTFITYDDEHHRAAFVKIDGLVPRPTNSVGVDHIAYSFRTISELLSHYQRLKQHAILPVWSINHGPTTSLYYRDPEGTMVEFQVDNYATHEEAAEYFKSENFKDNPIGVEFDPDAMVVLWQKGANEKELSKQGTAALPGGNVGPKPEV